MDYRNTNPRRFKIKHLEWNKSAVAEYNGMGFVNPINNTLPTNEIETDIGYTTVFYDIFSKELICLDEI